MPDCRQELLTTIAAGQRDGRAQRKFEILDRLSVSGGALAACDGMIGLEKINPISGPERLYEPAPGTVECLITPAMMIGGQVTDLVAIDFSHPERWWLRRGVAPVLGEENIERASFIQEPLWVHPNPLDWLKADAVGCTVLNWSSCLSLYLGGVERIIVADDAFGRKLRNAIKQNVRLPKIHVSGGLSYAA